MIHITQLIFVVPGKEEVFHQFEDVAIPLMKEYNGKLLYRMRPNEASFIDPEGEMPYEVHIVSFDSEEDLQRFLADERRNRIMHLKECSVRVVVMFKGEAL